MNWRWQLLALCLLLSACAAPPPPPPVVAVDPPPAILDEPILTAESYLANAQMALEGDKFDWSAMAVKAYYRGGEPLKAEALKNRLETDALSGQQRASLQLASAYGLQLQGQPDRIVSILNFSPLWSLPDDYWVTYYKMRADIFESQRNPVSAAQEKILLENYLIDEEELQVNRQQIWELLKPLSPFILRTFQRPNEPLQNGWFELAAIGNEPIRNADEFRQKIENWQYDYPDHPATPFVDENITNIIAQAPYQPQRIAVLLPLSGRQKTNGIAIRDGILAAKQDSQMEITPELVFLDTAQAQLLQLTEELQLGEYDFILGPLLKPNLEALRQQPIDIPWLGLNMSPSYSELQPLNQYSFALAPEQEAIQAAEFMAAQGEQYPQVLAPNSQTGKRMAQAFREAWLQYHEVAPGITYYSNRTDIQAAVKTLLDTDISQQRVSQVKQLLGSNLETELRSRRDTQAIYLIANNTDAKLIQPFIDVTVSPFADRISLYASSRTHSRSSDNKELNQMMVSEMPWILDTTSVNARRFVQLWPTANDTENRLYAMGYDSYNLIPKLNQMRGASNVSTEGLTGILSVNANGEVERQLIWSQYQDGQLTPIPLAPAIESTAEEGVTIERVRPASFNSPYSNGSQDF